MVTRRIGNPRTVSRHDFFASDEIGEKEARRSEAAPVASTGISEHIFSSSGKTAGVGAHRGSAPEPISMARPKRQAVQAVSTACCSTVSAVPDEV